MSWEKAEKAEQRPQQEEQLLRILDYVTRLEEELDAHIRVSGAWTSFPPQLIHSTAL
jgi:hypothetical protein